jgi:site-specific DNA-adenine methylase
MQNFSNFITEQKNTHMTHIEDKVLYGGVGGTRDAINALRSLRDMLAGVHSGSVSVKWDGAPAIFAGTDPRDGKFFVAKKGVFNKTPKVYKTPKDIDADTSGDLATKLKAALNYLPSLGIKGVIQGDFLFGPGDLKKKKIEGKQYITFHPNTIVYAVPYENSKEIREAEIGIVWHTTYKGTTFENMKASYGVNVAALKKNKSVWSQDAMLKNASNATLTAAETARVNEHLSNAGVLFNRIAGSTLRQLEANQELASLIETFNNTHVRKGVIITDTKRHAGALIRWIKQRYRAEAAKRKTEQGKETQNKKMRELLSFFSETNIKSLISMFDLQREIVLAKLILINKLNELQNIDTFVKTKKGYKVTGAEGYVAIDTLGGDAVKLVDRMEFSYNNFSPDVLKGWDSKSRS